MKKKLARLGNSTALIIDKPIMELLGIQPEDTVSLVTDGVSLVVTPVNRRSRKARVLEAIKFIHEKYGKALDELGDASSLSSSKDKT